MDVDWKELVVWFVGVTDWWELGWFVGVTVGVHAGVVSLLCAALALVERYKLFQEAKIQSKVFALQPSLDTLYCTTLHIYTYTLHMHAHTPHCIHTLHKHTICIHTACQSFAAQVAGVPPPTGLPPFRPPAHWVASLLCPHEVEGHALHSTLSLLVNEL